RCRINHDRLKLFAEQTALLVLLFDHHQDGVLQSGLGDRHRARQRVQHADLDGVGRLRREAGGTQRECRHYGFEFHEWISVKSIVMSAWNQNVNRNSIAKASESPLVSDSSMRYSATNSKL